MKNNLIKKVCLLAFFGRITSFALCLIVAVFAAQCAIAADLVLDLAYEDEGGAIVAIDKSASASPVFVRSHGGPMPVLVNLENQNVLEFLPQSRASLLPDAASPVQKLDEKFTISVWLFLTNHSNVMDLVSNATDIKREGFRLRILPRGSVAFESGSGTERSFFLKSPSGSLQLNDWNHVLISSDGSNVILFVNGEEKRSLPVGSANLIADRSCELVIGNYSGRKDAYPFEGMLGNIKIYNQPLEMMAIERLAADRPK